MKLTIGGMKFIAERGRSYLSWIQTPVSLATLLIVAKFPWWQIVLAASIALLILSLILIWDFRRGYRQEQTLANRILLEQIKKLLEESK